MSRERSREQSRWALAGGGHVHGVNVARAPAAISLWVPGRGQGKTRIGRSGSSECRRSRLALLAANLDEVGRPLGAGAIDRRRAAVPSARAGDRLSLVLVLVDHVLEGLIGDGRLDGRATVQRGLLHSGVRRVRRGVLTIADLADSCSRGRAAGSRTALLRPQVIAESPWQPADLAKQESGLLAALLHRFAPDGRLTDQPRADVARRFRRERPRRPPVRERQGERRVVATLERPSRKDATADDRRPDAVAAVP